MRLKSLSNSSGQSSIEFLSLVSMSALILAGMYGIMAAKEEKTFEYRNRDTAQKIAEKTGFQVEMAMAQGEGYSRIFSVPEKIAGEYYNVTLRSHSTIIEWGDETTTRPTLYDGEELNISTRNSNVLQVANSGNITLKEVN